MRKHKKKIYKVFKHICRKQIFFVYDYDYDTPCSICLSQEQIRNRAALKLLKNNYLVVPVPLVSMRIRIQGAKPMQIHANLPRQKAVFLHEKYTLDRY